MDAKTINEVSQKVYSKFPEVRGATPKVKAQTGDTFLLIFEGSGKTPDGKTIVRTVRAVVTSAGKITKLTTSR